MFKVSTEILRVGHRVRPGGHYKKTSITIHSTGNAGSSAENERAWLDNQENDRLAAWHFVVGNKKVIQAIPEDEEAWHCSRSEGNKHSIAIEIIESGDRAAVLNTAAEFTADLLKKYGWEVDKLKRHYDWTGKNCPRILIDKGYIRNGLNWAWYVATVEAYLKGSEKVTKPTKEKIQIDGKEYEAECVNIDGFTYWKVRDLAGPMGYDVSNKGKMPVLNKKGK
jgi:N-acetylmuramoyl-L-alanine amidase CwlA